MTRGPDIETLARAARAASRAVAAADTATKDAVLTDLAGRIDRDRGRVLEANARDVKQAEADGLAAAKLQRLVLDDTAIDRLVAGLGDIVELPDPVGAVTSELQRPSGLVVRRVRCPIGVIAMIYEARPAVTIDAFALCFKAGNAAILKGGKEADEANRALAGIAHEALLAHGLPAECLVAMTARSRDDLRRLLGMNEWIDLVIPRGGESLIRFVASESTIPTVQHYHGVCHAYVHAAADLDRAVAVCVNAKASAPATCNALECVLIDRAVADRFVPMLAAACAEAGVEVRGDDAVRVGAPDVTAASADDYGREFLDLVLAARVVDGLDEAIAHIEQYGSNHTDAILTADDKAAQAFMRRVQSSCVLVNASTRFNDGFELGLGAEIGISTQRVHAYGPMGLEELTVQRYVAGGDWLTR